MPKPYSNDLRWRVVWLYVHNLTMSEIAKQLCVSKRTVYRYIDQFERSGDITPKNYHHGPTKLLGESEQVILLRMILSGLVYTLVKFSLCYFQGLVLL